MKSLSKFLSFILFSIIALVTTSCATVTGDIEIETQANPEINFNAYKTYAWAGSAKVVFDPIGQWEQPTLDTDEEVRFVINRELRAHGFHQVEKNPDLFVAFAAGVDTTALELKEDPKTQEKIPTNIPKAALLIALVDANTGYVIWMGYAMGNVQEQQTIDNIRRRIDYAVSEIFKSYGK
jgi:hypothetical protein